MKASVARASYLGALMLASIGLQVLFIVLPALHQLSPSANLLENIVLFLNNITFVNHSYWREVYVGFYVICYFAAAFLGLIVYYFVQLRFRYLGFWDYAFYVMLGLLPIGGILGLLLLISRSSRTA